MWSAKLCLAYNGKNYVGWQVQKNGVSVQEKLEQAWLEVTGEQLRITASGRTDSGVHAYCQVCSLQTETHHAPSTLVRALNAKSPEDICVLSLERAKDGFHAIRDATGKTYQYRIQFERLLSPFELETCWFVPRELDIDSMRAAANVLLGTHDFASFESKGSPRDTTIREIRRLDLKVEARRQFKYLVIEISANGFLYNMARSIVGSLVEVGQGTRDVSWIKEVLASRNRDQAGMTAPAHALFLKSVDYPEDHLWRPSNEDSSMEANNP